MACHSSFFSCSITLIPSYLPHKVGDEFDFDSIPSVEEKISLSYEIFRLGNPEMAKVLTMIEEACPDALQRSAATDEVNI